MFVEALTDITTILLRVLVSQTHDIHLAVMVPQCWRVK
jgi:hypothetical protein